MKFDRRTYNVIKKDLNDLSEKINKLIFEENEPYDKKGNWDSGGSEQTWAEFFTLMSVSPAFAVGRELSSWHGARNKKLIDTPYSKLLPTMAKKIPVSDSWETWLIESGMKASDFIDGLKTDENGEYYVYSVGNQTVKLYLPNENFFNKFVGCLYKFKTDEGFEYSLDLILESNQTTLGGVIGGSDTKDSWKISLDNSNPSEGNGWTFNYGQNPNLPYFQLKGSNLIQVGNEELIEDLKSSFQLFWEEWGVTIQIVASLIVMVFAEPLGAMLMARWPLLAAEGIFNTSKGVVLAEFLLESVINVPSAVIDGMYGNEYGASLGIAFCFFPILIRTGRLGRFMSPSFDSNAAKQLADKIYQGVYQNMTPREFAKFLDTLTSQEKIYFSEGLSFLIKNGTDNSLLEQEIKKSLEIAISNKTFPTTFAAWLKRKGYGALNLSKILGAATSYIVITSAVYIGVKKLQEKNNDNRSREELDKDVQYGVEEVTEVFKSIDENSKITPINTLQIINSLVNEGDPEKGAEYYYQLSIGDRTSMVRIKIANKKIELAKKNLENIEILKSILQNPSETQQTYNDLVELNELANNPLKPEEINSLLINPETINVIDPLNMELTLNDSNHKMSKEYGELISRYPCIKDNFIPIEGDYSIDPTNSVENMWWIQMKPKSDTKLITPNGLRTIKKDEFLWIYNDGRWYIYPSDNHYVYKEFKCS